MAKSSVAASENGNRFLNVPFVTAVLLGGTLLATGLGAYFSYRQWQTSESYNQKSMRAYSFVDFRLEAISEISYSVRQIFQFVLSQERLERTQ